MNDEEINCIEIRTRNSITAPFRTWQTSEFLQKATEALTSTAPPLEIKGRVYASCVRSSMIYGSDTMPLLVDVVLKCKNRDADD